MSILDDEDRKRLLDMAGELTDRAAAMREQLRTSLFMLGMPIRVADAAVTVAQELEDLAFQRGRAIALLEHVDSLDTIDQLRGEG